MPEEGAPQIPPTPTPAPTPPPPRRFGCLQVLLIVLVAMLLTAVAAGWWVKHYLYASPFKPTTLSAREEKVLENKLEQLDEAAMSEAAEPLTPEDQTPKPERYTEDDSKREISITQKELNSLVGRDAQLGKHVAIHLADDLVSVNTVVPLEEDFPFIGGKTLRIKFGLSLKIDEGQAVASMRGVSLGGVPLPSAWWGDIKNKNLIHEFSGEGGFWDRFSRGVETIRISDGALLIKLKE